MTEFLADEIIDMEWAFVFFKANSIKIAEKLLFYKCVK
jgi:hypothetical protein